MPVMPEKIMTDEYIETEIKRIQVGIDSRNQQNEEARIRIQELERVQCKRQGELDTKKHLRDTAKAQIFGVNVQIDDADLAEVPLGTFHPDDFRPFSRKLNIVFKGGGQFLFSDYIWGGKVFTSEAEMIDYAVDEMLKQLGLVE